jgi:hypothetical protein
VNIPGGVGFNVRYTFTTEKSFIIDYGSYYKTKLCWLKKDPDENDPDIDDPDYKYWNIFMRNNPTSGNRDDYNTLYKDPSTNEFKGYARDEIYAFSMVLFDKYNNPSNPLWIGDIRFPRNQDIDPINRREIGGKYTDINHPNQGNFNYFNGGYAYPLGLRVSIRSGFLSDNKNGVTSYKIVRCDRGSSGRSPVSSNKSILSFGAIGNIRLAIAMNLSQAANGGKSEAHRWVFSHYPEMGMSNHIDMIDGDQHLNGYDRTDYDEDFINTPSNWVSRWNGVLKESPWSNELCQDTGNYHSRYLYFISPEAQIGLPFSNTQESKDAAKLNADNIGKYFRDATFMEFSNVLSSL